MAERRFLGIRLGKKEKKVEQVELGSMKVEHNKDMLNYFSLSSNQTTSVAQLSPNISYDFSKPMEFESFVNGKNWVEFGVDGLYNYLLTDLYNSSPMNASIIKFKKLCLVGKGIEVIDNSKELKTRTNAKAFTKLFTRRFLDDLAFNYVLHGSVFIKTIWDDSHKNIIRLKVIPSEQIKIGAKNCFKGIEGYWFSYNWKKVNQKGEHFDYTPAFIPSFNVNMRNQNEQIYGFHPVGAGLLFNAKPSYSSALNWIQTDGQQSYYHKQNLENSINLSAIITLIGEVESPEEAKKIKARVKQELQGIENSGVPAILHAKNKDVLPTITSFPANQLGESFIQSQQMIKENICIAHNVDPAIMGIAKQGQLGNVQQLKDLFQIFSEQVIQPMQEDIEEILNEFLVSQGYTAAAVKLKPFNLGIMKQLPAELLAVLTVDEKRQAAGYEALPIKDDGSSGAEQTITERLGIGGTQNLIGVVGNPDLSEIQKLQMLQVVFGLSEEQSKKLIYGQ